MNPRGAIVVGRSKVVRALSLVAATLVVASLVVDYGAIITGAYDFRGWLPRFDLDAEGNVPTFFSACLILIAALLTAICGALTARRLGRDRNYWSWLSFILTFLSVDEAARIHELASTPVRKALGDLGPAFLFAWVIPGTIFVAVLGAAFVPFLLRLPPKTRSGFVLAAAVYVAGAIGMEMLGAAYQGPSFDQRDPIYTLIFTCEESMEMAGMIVFINALLRHIETEYQAGDRRLQLGT